MKEQVKILYAASEAVPFASTGGLGDVIGSLPFAVKKRYGERADVRVVMPMYPCVKETYAKELCLLSETTASLAWRNQYCGIWYISRNDVTFYFIDNEYYFRRVEMYGNYDDGERFAFFGKAILSLMQEADFYPDVFHANDWQTAPAVIYLKRKTLLEPACRNIRVLYTIHNIAYQGIYDFSVLQDVLELAEWDRPVVEYNGAVNLTKGAIVCADRISTVSPRYAVEIQSPYASYGLHPILQMYAQKLSGIINGIDTEIYDETAVAIRKPYLENDRSGKDFAKKKLQTRCGFPQNGDIPVIAMISRLTMQKGFDLVMCVLEEFLRRNLVQFVLLGTGNREVENYFHALQEKLPEQCCAHIRYDRELANVIYAGADMFLMPSRNEPCGIAQMIASYYGTVPIVRETGGLSDTIHPYQPYSGEGNGFTFQNYNAHDMMYEMQRALEVYRQPEAWMALVRRVMQMDFSWTRSAEQYSRLYESML